MSCLHAILLVTLYILGLATINPVNDTSKEKTSRLPNQIRNDNVKDFLTVRRKRQATYSPYHVNDAFGYYNPLQNQYPIPASYYVFPGYPSAAGYRFDNAFPNVKAHVDSTARRTLKDPCSLELQVGSPKQRKVPRPPCSGFRCTPWPPMMVRTTTVTAELEAYPSITALLPKTAQRTEKIFKPITERPILKFTVAPRIEGSKIFKNSKTPPTRRPITVVTWTNPPIIFFTKLLTQKPHPKQTTVAGTTSKKPKPSATSQTTESSYSLKVSETSQHAQPEGSSNLYTTAFPNGKKKATTDGEQTTVITKMTTHHSTVQKTNVLTEEFTTTAVPAKTASQITSTTLCKSEKRFPSTEGSLEPASRERAGMTEIATKVSTIEHLQITSKNAATSDRTTILLKDELRLARTVNEEGLRTTKTPEPPEITLKLETEQEMTPTFAKSTAMPNSNSTTLKKETEHTVPEETTVLEASKTPAQEFSKNAVEESTIPTKEDMRSTGQSSKIPQSTHQTTVSHQAAEENIPDSKASKTTAEKKEITKQTAVDVEKGSSAPELESVKNVGSTKKEKKPSTISTLNEEARVKMDGSSSDSGTAATRPKERLAASKNFPNTVEPAAKSSRGSRPNIHTRQHFETTPDEKPIETTIKNEVIKTGYITEEKETEVGPAVSDAAEAAITTLKETDEASLKKEHETTVFGFPDLVQATAGYAESPGEVIQKLEFFGIKTGDKNTADKTSGMKSITPVKADFLNDSAGAETKSLQTTENSGVKTTPKEKTGLTGCEKTTIAVTEVTEITVEKTSSSPNVNFATNHASALVSAISKAATSLMETENRDKFIADGGKNEDANRISTITDGNHLAFKTVADVGILPTVSTNATGEKKEGGKAKIMVTDTYLQTITRSSLALQTNDQNPSTGPNTAQTVKNKEATATKTLLRTSAEDHLTGAKTILESPEDLETTTLAPTTAQERTTNATAVVPVKAIDRKATAADIAAKTKQATNLASENTTAPETKSPSAKTATKETKSTKVTTAMVMLGDQTEKVKQAMTLVANTDEAAVDATASIGSAYHSESLKVTAAAAKENKNAQTNGATQSATVTAGSGLVTNASPAATSLDILENVSAYDSLSITTDWLPLAKDQETKQATDAVSQPSWINNNSCDNIQEIFHVSGYGEETTTQALQEATTGLMEASDLASTPVTGKPTTMEDNIEIRLEEEASARDVQQRSTPNLELETSQRNDFQGDETLPTSIPVTEQTITIVQSSTVTSTSTDEEGPDDEEDVSSTTREQVTTQSTGVRPLPQNPGFEKAATAKGPSHSSELFFFRRRKQDIPPQSYQPWINRRPKKKKTTMKQKLS